MKLGAGALELGLKLGEPPERLGELARASLGRLLLDFLGRRARREHLPLARAVAVHSHAFAAELEGEAVDLLDVLLGGLVREVAGLGDRRVGELLERALHPDVPLRRHVVRGHEHALPLGRHGVEANVPHRDDLLHEGVAVPAFLLRDGDEVLVDVRHEDAGLVAHERHGEQRLDPGGAAGDDGDGAGRRHGGQVAVAQPLHRPQALARRTARAGGVRAPDGARPLGEDPTLLGELLGSLLGLLVHELHQPATQRDALVAVVGDAEPHQQIRPAHDAQADTPNALGEIVDLGERVPVGVDDVVQEVRAEVHRRSQPVPFHLAVLDEQADIDRAEVADVVRQQRLLPARIGRFVAAQVRDRVVPVGAVYEENARLARFPRAVHDRAKHLAGIELPHDPPGTGVEEIVAGALLHRLHESVGDGHGDVEVRHLRQVVLAGDELQDVRVIDTQDAHVGAAACAALLDDIGRGIVELHERDGTRGDAHGGAHHVVLGPQPREGEARAAARLVH